jgi:hypothetical protein
MGRDPEYLRFIRNVASALATAGDVALVYAHGGGA